LTNDNKKIKTKKKKVPAGILETDLNKFNLYPKRNLFEKNTMRVI
jgi:hypothetical protein